MVLQFSQKVESEVSLTCKHGESAGKLQLFTQIWFHKLDLQRLKDVQNGLASGTADNLEHGQVVKFQTFHIVKQKLANGGGAGLGLGLRLGLRSIRPCRRSRPPWWASKAMPAHVVWLVFPGAAWHTPTSTSAREEINHVRLLVGGENVLAAFWNNIGLEVKMTWVWQTGYALCAVSRTFISKRSDMPLPRHGTCT